MTKQLVSAQWVKTHLQDENIVLLDASSTFDHTTTITKAQHFDIANVFSDMDSPFPNTFPSAEQFERESQKLGINDNSHIIVFDDKGIFTSPRVWWMFKTMGHHNVSVLDGGLPEWLSHKFSIGNERPLRRSKGTFKVQFNRAAVKFYNQIVNTIKQSNSLIIDARSKGRFQGTATEPRSHIKSGQIPTALNLPYTDVLENGKYKSKEELQKIFDQLQLPDKPIIFSCGSGISACIILLALHLIADRETSVYDGSWTEWAEKQGLFVG